MARLFHAGAEASGTAGGENTAEGVQQGGGLSGDIVAAAARTGAFGYRVLGTAANPTGQWQYTFTSVDGRDYFARDYVAPNFNPASVLTTGGVGVLELSEGGAAGYFARMVATGWELWYDPSGAPPPVKIGSTGGPAAASGVFQRVDLRVRRSGGAGFVELFVDETLVATETGRTISAPNILMWGTPTVSQVLGVGNNIYHDDLALNDSVVPTGYLAGQPGAQDTYPGPGHVFLVKPTADAARHADWLAGAGGTTNLFEALNNTPPVGIAASTNASQVKDSTAGGTAEDLDLTLQTYDAAGVSATDAIRVAHTIINTAAGSSVAGMGALLSVSNPAEAAETTFDPKAPGTMATFPNGWKATRGPMIYLPSVNKAVAPVVRIGKRGASTARMDADLVGLMVDAGDPVTGGGGRTWL